MASSLNDALKKSGIAQPETAEPERGSAQKEWLHGLPDEESRPAYVPFDAPALTKVRESKKPTG